MRLRVTAAPFFFQVRLCHTFRTMLCMFTVTDKARVWGHCTRPFHWMQVKVKPMPEPRWRPWSHAQGPISAKASLETLVTCGGQSSPGPCGKVLVTASASKAWVCITGTHATNQTVMCRFFCACCVIMNVYSERWAAVYQATAVVSSFLPAAFIHSCEAIWAATLNQRRSHTHTHTSGQGLIVTGTESSTVGFEEA